MKLSNPQIELQNKIKYFILTLILLISVNVCFSQDNFIPGYILLANGDTVKGEILDEDEIISSQLVVFRENDSSANQYFIPKDILAYYISDNRYYESRIFNYYQEIPIRKLQIIVNTSKESPSRSAFEVVKDTAFLRVVVKGQGEILIYNETNGDVKYYVETPKAGLKQLIKDKTYYPKNNGGIGFRTKNTIKDTLQYVTSDCGEDLYYEKRSKIYLTDLIDLMMDYNTCIGSKSEIIQPRQTVKVRFGINFGINFSNIISNEDKHEYIDQSKYIPKNGLFVGLSADWYLNKSKEKGVLQTELCYSQIGADSDGFDTKVYYYNYNHYGIPRDTSVYLKQYKIDAKFINLGISGKYFLNQRHKTLRPYLSGGILLGLVINQKNAFEITSYTNDNKYVYYPKFPTAELGIMGKAGFIINVKNHLGFYAELRGSYSKLYHDGTNSRLVSTLYNFTLGIYL